MRVRIVAAGRVREPYLQDGIEEYAARLRPYMRVEMIEIPDEKVPTATSPRGLARIMEKEGEKLLAAARGDGVLVALDPAGEEWSSEDLARYLSRWRLEGHSAVTFIIGGSLGLSPAVRKSARHTLSLSRMTFPHQMARLILFEQLFRAQKIARGEPYHK